VWPRTSMHADNNRTRLVGWTSAQYLIARLYEFFDNHSISSLLNCSLLGLLGRRLDAFTCAEAAQN
jgi:hypothetical protein